jgi:hypothetical protein
MSYRDGRYIKHIQVERKYESRFYMAEKAGGSEGEGDDKKEEAKVPVD